jgi:hypothetical protein
MLNGAFVDKNTQKVYSYDQSKLLNSLDAISSAATQQEKIDAIENLFFDISASPMRDAEMLLTDKMKFAYDSGVLSMLIRAVAVPIVRVLFSPKVLLVLYANAEIMGKTPPSVIDLIKSLLSVITNLIRQIKDILLERLMEWVISVLKPILQAFSSLLFLEMLREYRELLEVMLDCIVWFKPNRLLTAIDDVNYADITTPLESPDQNKC